MEPAGIKIAHTIKKMGKEAEKWTALVFPFEILSWTTNNADQIKNKEERDFTGP